MSSTYSPGLEGITAGISAISEVDAERHTLAYRGYDIHDLVCGCSFDEVAYLLLYGSLPNPQQYADFDSEVRANRAVPETIYDLYATFPRDAQPMDTLKAAVAVLALSEPDGDDSSRAANLRRATRLYAKVPALVVNGYRIMQGQQPIAPDPDLDHTANFFHMLTGSAPTDLRAKAFNVIQILYAEHGFNASTFAARVTVSTLSDMYSGVVSAIGTLKGPLHGGANEAAMQMLLEIDDPEKAEAWVIEALALKKKIMGFGHREYKKGDERARIAKQFMIELSKAKAGNAEAGAGQDPSRWQTISQTVEETMLAKKGLFPNLDFPVAAAYYLMDIPVPLYTPIFVMSRITGWCAHIIEQLENNRIIRPSSEYNGLRGLQFVPLAERK